MRSADNKAIELGVADKVAAAIPAPDRVLDRAVSATLPANRSYGTLEGMRGLGAITVMLYHYLPHTPFPGTYVAVDMFFLMSGIVLGERYLGDFERGRISAARFCVMRAIRILPLYWFGMALGVAIIGLGMALGTGENRGFGAFGMVVVGAIPAFFMIPNLTGPVWLFPLNVPAWSLFFELVANFAFAVFAPYRIRTLVVIIVVGGIAVAIGGFTNQTLDIGSKYPDFIWGIARVSYSFFAGVLIAKMKGREFLPWLRLPSWLMVLLFALTLFTPYSGPVAGVLAPAIVLFFYPVMMMVARRTEPGPRLGRLSQSLGGVSFALYAIHVPLMMGFVSVARKFRLPIEPTLLVCAPIALACAYAALHYFDIPLRRWLTAYSKRFFAATGGGVQSAA